jgi:alpha-glucosidase
MPWDAPKPNLGFSGSAPWLPLGPDHATLAVSVQQADANSTLAYARALLKTRKTLPAMIDGELELLDAPDPVIAFLRGGKILCLFNLGDEARTWALPRPASEITMGTGGAGLEGGVLTLPPSSAWFGQL